MIGRNTSREKIDDPDLRADAISFVLYRAALFFVSKPDVAKAIDLVSMIAEPARQAVVKIAIAQSLLSSKSSKGEPGEASLAQQRALDLLNDLDRELKKGNPSSNAARILLGRTAILAKLDQDQALTSLDQAVQMINKLDRFDLRNGTAPNLGIGTVSNSGATVATPRIGFDFRSAIDPLINTNFEQISAIAERLTAKEQNGLARLEAAKLYLSKNRYSTVEGIKCRGSLILCLPGEDVINPGVETHGLLLHLLSPAPRFCRPHGKRSRFCSWLYFWIHLGESRHCLCGVNS